MENAKEQRTEIRVVILWKWLEIRMKKLSETIMGPPILHDDLSSVWSCQEQKRSALHTRKLVPHEPEIKCLQRGLNSYSSEDC